MICSKDSLQSVPVIREIERALQKEDREHKNVLFPIRIDDYLFDEWDHPRKADSVLSSNECVQRCKSILDSSSRASNPRGLISDCRFRIPESCAPRI